MRVPTLREHVEYLKFATRAVARSNRLWRLRHPGRGEMVIDRTGLHAWLYRRAVRRGLIEYAGPSPARPLHAYVAVAFAADPDAVREEALAFWRRSVEARLAAERGEEDESGVSSGAAPVSDN